MDWPTVLSTLSLAFSRARFEPQIDVAGMGTDFGGRVWESSDFYFFILYRREAFYGSAQEVWRAHR